MKNVWISTPRIRGQWRQAWRSETTLFLMFQSYVFEIPLPELPLRGVGNEASVRLILDANFKEVTDAWEFTILYGFSQSAWPPGAPKAFERPFENDKKMTIQKKKCQPSCPSRLWNFMYVDICKCGANISPRKPWHLHSVALVVSLWMLVLGLDNFVGEILAIKLSNKVGCDLDNHNPFNPSGSNSWASWIFPWGFCNIITHHSTILCSTTVAPKESPSPLSQTPSSRWISHSRTI